MDTRKGLMCRVVLLVSWAPDQICNKWQAQVGCTILLNSIWIQTISLANRASGGKICKCNVNCKSCNSSSVILVKVRLLGPSSPALCPLGPLDWNIDIWYKLSLKPQPSFLCSSFLHWDSVIVNADLSDFWSCYIHIVFRCPPSDWDWDQGLFNNVSVEAHKSSRASPGG